MSVKLILAHGVLGFGSNPFLKFVGINYFREISEHINQNIIRVYEPSVNPIGTVDTRAAELTKYIKRKTDSTDEVHIIAHSMGGLDARRAILNNPDIQERIKTLVTVGTPHSGSEVADAIYNGTEITPELEPIIDFLPDEHQGLEDLTTAVCKKHLNENWSNIKTQKYCIAGNPKSVNPPKKLSLLLYLASELGGIDNEINDGVVTKKSALMKDWEALDDWPADHTELIGWDLDNPIFISQDHIDRYMNLIEKITRIKKENFYID